MGETRMLIQITNDSQTHTSTQICTNMGPDEMGDWNKKGGIEALDQSNIMTTFRCTELMAYW